MRIRFILFVLASVLLGVGGCENAERGSELFTVDFQQGSELKYELVSERQIDINLDPTGKYSKSSKGKRGQTITEKMELVISYRILEAELYGPSVIEGNCLSAKVTRTAMSRGRAGKKDAVEFLSGKTFTFKIDPSGKIEDYSQLDKLAKELGKKAFGDSKRGRIKDPDMIMDFAAMQWFLWDTVSSIPEPIKGLRLGQSWKSRLLVPMPAPSRIGRDAVYRFEEIRESEGKRLAVIKSEFSLAEAAPAKLPIPYSGSMQMRGIFGFLRGYKPVSLSGAGEQLFDIDGGVLESDIQNYEVKIKAAMMFNLGSDSLEPNMTVRQNFRIKLIEAK